MRRPVLLLLSFAMIAPECLAQSPAQTPSSMPANHKLEFDVASVRENKSGGPATSNFPLDRGGAYSSTGGAFSATNQSLVGLLIFAYKINISEFRGGLMNSLPGWAKTDKFDVYAKAASENPTKEEMRQMVQSLLVDRFKLKVHGEQRQMPVFGLYLSEVCTLRNGCGWVSTGSRAAVSFAVLANRSCAASHIRKPDRGPSGVRHLVRL